MVVGVNGLLDCLELNTPVNVRDIEDIIRIERRNDSQLNQNNNENLSSTSPQLYYLIIDVDSTLERLYGGFHPDWLAGGEWSHLYSYILSLHKTCQDLSLCLIFCFDGTLYRYGRSSWYHEQIQQRKKVNQIFKHLKQNKSGLPRRHLWLAPAALQLCLKMIIREFNSLNMILYQTWGYNNNNIHREQIQNLAIKYDKYLLGIVSIDFEFLLNSISNKNTNTLILLKFFSAKHFKLSLKGKLSLMEIKLNQLQDKFSLDNQRFSLLTALLGNHILSDTDLIHFHNDLLREHDYVTPSSKRILLKTNGNTSPPAVDLSIGDSKIDNHSPDTNLPDNSEDQQQTSSVTSPVHFGRQSRHSGSTPSTFDQLIPRLVDYIRKQTVEPDIDFNLIGNQVFKHVIDDEMRKAKIQLLIDAYHYYLKAISKNQTLTDSIESSHPSPLCSSQTKSDDDEMLESILNELAPGVNSEVVRTAFNLHRQGSMMPWIFQCLYKQEITFPVTIEPEMCNTIPSACEFFRPIRACAYSLLLGPDRIVREQVYNSEHGSYLTEVKSELLPSIITIEQLWFGTSPDEDRQCRLQTFLQCMHYCDLPILYSISHEYLLFISILRYIFMELFRLSSITNGNLQIYELMAFISQAVITTELQPKPLMNVKTSTTTTATTNQYDHIQIINYETRPVQLAHLFMRGLETAIFANEVCGAPIHPKYCSVAHFFNGKLFHHKYSQAQYYQQNQDLMMILCDGNPHCAQVASQLLDAVLDRSPIGNLHQTPLHPQPQPQYVVPQQQQQRVLRYPSSQQPRASSYLANSTRPPMRVHNNPVTTAFNNQQQTPVTNCRQQPQPPPIKAAAHMRNGGPRKNHNASPFDAKNQLQSSKFTVRTPINVSVAQQQPPPGSLYIDQWTGHASSTIPSNHLSSMPPQPNSTHTIQQLPAAALQHQQMINNNFMNPFEEQLMQVQLHQQPPPPQMMGTPMSFHPAQFMGPHLQIASFAPLYQPPPPFAIATGPPFYQPSPPAPSTSIFQQQHHPIATPYHSHHPQMLPGLPPHAPLPPQRTVGFVPSTTNNTYSQPSSNRHSPTSIQTQELNVQALQQRILEQQKQQTPISIQRQLNRAVLSGEYAPYDIHHSTPTNGITPAPLPVTIQSRHHPSMIMNAVEHQQLPHGL